MIKKILIILFLFSINAFAQSRFYPDGDTLKPKDPKWGVQGDFLKFNGGIIYVDTTGGDTVKITSDGNIPFKINSVVVDNISSQNFYVLAGGSSYAVEGQLGSDGAMVFNSTMTRQEIQDSINMIPKNLGGHTFTFQFSDGTYDLDSTLVFKSFYGGILNIYGNISESGLHTNQAVILNQTESVNASIYIAACNCSIEILNIKATTTTAMNGFEFERNFGSIIIRGCYAIGVEGVGSGYKFWSATSTVNIQTSYVTGFLYGIEGFVGAIIISIQNLSVGTNPVYGLLANASIIMKSGATQPTGSTANELVQNGGVIR